MSKLAVVIVTYNGRQYLADCFSSIEKQTKKPEEIIVIDNNSTDGTQEFLGRFKIKDLRLKIILNQENLGFAKANNQGMEVVLKDGADYIFLLNQDTRLAENCLEELLKTAEGKNFFAYQPLVLCYPQKNLIQTSGDRIHFLGFGYSGGYGLPPSAKGYGGSSEALREVDRRSSEALREEGEIKEIPYASGATMFIKSEVLKEVGLFDEDLFMYHEDMDLCLRGRLLGKKIFLVPQAIVYHQYQEKITPLKWAWSERNRQLTLLKFYKFPSLLLIFPCWLIMEIGSLFYSALIGALFLKIKGYFEILSLTPKFLAKRKKIQKSRKIKDKELAKYLDGKFRFAAFRSPLFYLINPILGISWQAVKKIMFW